MNYLVTGNELYGPELNQSSLDKIRPSFYQEFELVISQGNDRYLSKIVLSSILSNTCILNMLFVLLSEIKLYLILFSCIV